MRNDHLLNKNLIHLADGYHVKVKHVLGGAAWLAVFMVILNLIF